MTDGSRYAKTNAANVATQRFQSRVVIRVSQRTIHAIKPLGALVMNIDKQTPRKETKMNKLFAGLLLFVFFSGCSKKEESLTKCQETYNKLIRCFPTELRNISERKFIAHCEMSKTASYVGMGECSVFDKCTDILECVSVLGK